VTQSQRPDQIPRQRTRRNGEPTRHGCYVYGIFPGDIRVDSDFTGVGDPPASIRAVRDDDLAAVISTVDLDRPLGTPEDLRAHKRILDDSVTEVPVLPLRFGAVLSDEDAVLTELLQANHDSFAAALGELDGRVQYVVKGRYVEPALLSEVLSESREARQLRRDIKGSDPAATRDARMRLGEIISDAIEVKRDNDTRMLSERMDGHCVASAVRAPSHEMDAVHVAFLLEQGREGELQQVVDGLAADWDGRVDLRVVGPMAAYDFAVSSVPRG
jgi:Gas vesicle synthesis protein GvpL/GvpF